MAPAVTYSRKRRRPSLVTPDRVRLEGKLKKRRTTFVLSEDEICDSEEERETSPPENIHPGFHSSSVTQVEPSGSDEGDEEADDDPMQGTQLGSVIHKVPLVALTEDDNLQIIGEIDPSDLTNYDGDVEDEEDTVPVRELYDFAIYDMDTLQLVPVAQLLWLTFGNTIYGASGIVKPHRHREHDYDEDDEDDIIDEEEVDDSLLGDQFEQYVKLSKINEFDIHHVPHGKRKKVLDSKIYIRTKYAWYILVMPSALYKPFFVGFWLQHRMLHLVVKAALAPGRITLDQFVSSLEVMEDSPNSVVVARKMLGRDLNAADVESDDFKAYLLTTLDELRDYGIKIERVPLIRALRGETNSSIPDGSPSRPAALRKRSSQASRLNDPEKEVLKHRNPTVVTPIVSSVAKKLFGSLNTAGTLDDHHEAVTDDSDPVFMHQHDPETIEWLEFTDEDGFYSKVVMDGVTYAVGDSVIVMPGTDDDTTRAANHKSKKATSTNTLGNTMWFCRISYMYEKDGEQLFHGQWYTHGSKMLLQETAHQQSLFLMDSCEDDISLATIVQKCNVRELAIDETEPIGETNANDNKFHTGFLLIDHDSSLIHLSPNEIEDALSYCDNGKQCLACGLSEAKRLRTECTPLPARGFFNRGFRYHIHDFVYLIPSSNSGQVYDIGQITNIQAMHNPRTISVRLFGRFDDVVRLMRKEAEWNSALETDERRLFQTPIVTKVRADHVDGKCYVRQLTVSHKIDDWVRHQDHFYVNQWAESKGIETTDSLQELAPDELECCSSCHIDHVQELAHAERLLRKNGPLRGLELFSGAGGLGTGLNKSGFVETRWAVEFSPSAALTYQTNHKNTIVYNQCSNVLLQDAINVRDGKKCERPRDLHLGAALLKMPKPGDVDFIYGGPPCQSFSGANHHKKADDIRSTLICNMISYVEFYHPWYFLLENVLGLLQYKLMGRMIGGAFAPDEGIEMGVLKFIVRSLTSLGYQVRFKVCQAGQYGAPQGRKRVLFWGAKRGFPLPEFPIPTHGYKGSFYHTLPTKAKIPPPSRSLDPDNPHQYAPLHAVTITDAIGDLPPFDWINPCEIIRGRTARQKAEDRSRSALLPSFNAVSGRGQSVYPGFTNPEKYAHKPLSRYQRAIRAQANNEKVAYQFTRRFGAGVVERVTCIPMRPFAFHDDLPKQLRMNAVVEGRVKERSFISLYGRMDGDGFFKTAMTTVAPNQKGGDILHPSQKRIVTVRECARAQGFPDEYQFLSVNTRPEHIIADQHRQIGNAVPVPLAMALGKALGDALLKMWQEEDRVGSPEV